MKAQALGDELREVSPGSPEPGDTWCTACCAWESLGSELCSPWHSRALRHVATDQVESLVRSVRALRNLSSSLKSAETSRAAEKERSGASRSQAARPVVASAASPSCEGLRQGAA